MIKYYIKSEKDLRRLFSKNISLIEIDEDNSGFPHKLDIFELQGQLYYKCRDCSGTQCEISRLAKKYNSNKLYINISYHDYIELKHANTNKN